MATGVLAGLAAGTTFLFGILDVVGAPVLQAGLSDSTRLAVDAGTMATGVAGATLASLPVRRQVARILPIDAQNPVHALALVLAVILFGTQLTSIAFTDVLASDHSQPALTLADLLLQEAPFLILAFAGVGIFLRRNTADSARRLGLVVPRWWQVAAALAASGAFFGFSLGMDWLSHQLTPDVAHRVDAATQHLFGGLSGPAGVAVLALAPGICEEILFRGALQPRLGVVVTALLFTSIHTQYGLSFDALAVFVIALGLGLIRKYTNTTSSTVCHATYNLLAGASIGGWALGVGGVVEAALLAVSGYVLLTQYRKRREAAAGAAAARP